jgi:hypothetical protein
VLARDDLADYIADNYGTCDLGALYVCLKSGNPWVGRGCRHWNPADARDWDEMRALARRLYGCACKQRAPEPEGA